MELGFVITNEKASYVAKEDSICLLSVAREASMDKIQIKPCVPFIFNIYIYIYLYIFFLISGRCGFNANMILKESN